MRNFNEKESAWLKLFLAIEYNGRNQIKSQLNNALVVPNYGKHLIELKFSLPAYVEKYTFKYTVPVSIKAVQKSGPPVGMDLFVKNGYIDMLEIYNWGYDELDLDFSIDDLEYEIR